MHTQACVVLKPLLVIPGPNGQSLEPVAHEVKSARRHVLFGPNAALKSGKFHIKVQISGFFRNRVWQSCPPFLRAARAELRGGCPSSGLLPSTSCPQLTAPPLKHQPGLRRPRALSGERDPNRNVKISQPPASPSRSCVRRMTFGVRPGPWLPLSEPQCPIFKMGMIIVLT